MTIARARGGDASEQGIVTNMEDKDSSDGLEDGGSSPVDNTQTPSTSNDQSGPESVSSPLESSNAVEAVGERDRPSTNGRSTPSQSGMRSSSSRFASLRAAFEQNPAADSSPVAARSRVMNSGKGNDMGPAQRQEYETELARLKDELAKGKDIQISLEEKVAVLEEEREGRAAGLAINEHKRVVELETSTLRAEVAQQKEMRAVLEDKLVGFDKDVSGHAILKDELSKEKEMRIAYEEKVTSLEEDVEDLNTALEQRDEQWRSEFEKRSAQLMEEAEDRLDALADEARRRQMEALNAQKQLVDLKQSIAVSTRVGTEVSDTAFQEDVALLQYEVQNWVINNFRRVKSEMSPERLCEKFQRVAEPKQLEYLKPIYEKFEPSARLPILQATVACYVMEIFDEPYLFGLPGQRDWGKRSRQAADALRSVFDPETYNRWRVLTFDALMQSASIKEPTENAAGGMTEMICITLQALTDAEDSASWQSSLKPIIQRAISLAHLIRVQHAVYQFTFPPLGQPLEPATMEDVAEDGDDDAERIVRCATFPGVIKLSDEQSDSTDAKQVVVKAKVVCFSTNDDEP